MGKVAIDVVILPSEQVMDASVLHNKKLAKNTKQEIILDKETCIPHISLSMGVIDEKNVKEINKALHDLASHFNPLSLKANKIKTKGATNTKSVSWLVIEKTDKLQSLHNLIMTKMSSFWSHGVKPSMFVKVNGQEINTTSMKWVENYVEQSAFERFEPHITLGFGKAGKLEKPLSFTATRLVLAHLGNNCTVRKVLAEYTLGKG